MIKLSKKTLSSVFFVIGFSISPITFALTNPPLPASCPQLSQLDQSKLKSSMVEWLPDGDTIHTKSGEKLRLLHINTPELNASKYLTDKPQPFALAAKNELNKLIGKTNKIYWLTDEKKKDKYGRYLALIFNDSGILINAQMALVGLAHSLVIPPNQLYWQCIHDAESQAYAAKKAIWSDPYFKAKNASQIKTKQAAQLVKAKIIEVKNTKKYRWLILEGDLWVGIKRRDFKYFNQQQLTYQLGDEITLRGYPYQSHGKIRMNLQHPAMILSDLKVK